MFSTFFWAFKLTAFILMESNNLNNSFNITDWIKDEKIWRSSQKIDRHHSIFFSYSLINRAFFAPANTIYAMHSFIHSFIQYTQQQQNFFPFWARWTAVGQPTDQPDSTHAYIHIQTHYYDYLLYPSNKSKYYIPTEFYFFVEQFFFFNFSVLNLFKSNLIINYNTQFFEHTN